MENNVAYEYFNVYIKSINNFIDVYYSLLKF